MVKSLKDKQIAELTSDIQGWMGKGLALEEEREKLKEQITALQEREKVLILRLQSHGDIATDREEALWGEEVKDD